MFSCISVRVLANLHLELISVKQKNVQKNNSWKLEQNISVRYHLSFFGCFCQISISANESSLVDKCSSILVVTKDNSHSCNVFWKILLSFYIYTLFPFHNNSMNFHEFFFVFFTIISKAVDSLMTFFIFPMKFIEIFQDKTCFSKNIATFLQISQSRICNFWSEIFHKLFQKHICACFWKNSLRVNFFLQVTLFIFLSWKCIHVFHSKSFLKFYF